MIVKLLTNYKKKSLFTRFDSYDNFDCLAFKNRTLNFEKSMYLRLCELEPSELHMWKTE